MAAPGDYRARMRDHKGRSRPISIFSKFNGAPEEKQPTNYVLLKDYLTKAPEKVGRWRRRWFELHKQGPRYVVHYWDDSNKKVKKGSFDIIKGSVLYLPQTEKALRGFVFQINIPKPNKRTYMLAADTEAQFMRWIMAMESAVRQDVKPPDGLQVQYLNTPETQRSKKTMKPMKRSLPTVEEQPKAPAARQAEEDDIRARTFTNMVQKEANPSRPSLNPKLRTTVSAAAAAAAKSETTHHVTDREVVEAVKENVTAEDERNFLAGAALTEELMLADEKLLSAKGTEQTSARPEKAVTNVANKEVPGSVYTEEVKPAEATLETQKPAPLENITEESAISMEASDATETDQVAEGETEVAAIEPEMTPDQAASATLTEEPPAITVNLDPVDKWGVNFAGTIDVKHQDMEESLRIYLPGVRTYDPAGISGDPHASERVGNSCETTLTYLVTAQLAILKTTAPPRSKDSLLADIQRNFQPIIKLYHGRVALYDFVYRQIQAAFFFKRVPTLPEYLHSQLTAGMFPLDLPGRDHSVKYLKSLDAGIPRPPTEFFKKLLSKESVDDIAANDEAKKAINDMAESEEPVHANIVPAYFSAPEEVLQALKSLEVVPEVANLYKYDKQSGLFCFSFTETGVAYGETEETSETAAAQGSLISITDLPPFPSVGVSIDLLKEFAANSEKDWTTTDACMNKIIPLTAEKKCSYAELQLDEDAGDKRFGKPTHFVSHAWRYNFHNLVDALESYAEDAAKNGDGKPLFFWVDMFVVNQHIAPSYPQEWWSTTFKQAIADIGETVLVMEPWSDPVPLTRAWCLWEILCTVASKTKLSIRMARDQHEHFHRALLERFDDVLTSLSKVDGQRAEAFNEADKIMIFQAVRKSVGFLALNGVVKEEIRYWLAESAEKALAEAEANLPTPLNEDTVIVPNPDYKELEEGEEQEEGKPAPSKTMIESNVNYVLRLKNGLASLNIMLGKPDLAETMLKELIEFASPILGSKHHVTVKFASDLATVLLKTGKMEEAEVFHRFVYEADLESHGPKHHDSLTSLSNLITFLGRAGKLEEAATLSLECIQGFRELCGDKSDETLKAINNYSVVLEYLENWPEAIKAANEAYEGYIELLGPKHPLTLTLVNNLGSAYFNLGDIAKADQHYRLAVNGLTETLGAGHPDTMEAVYNLGMMLFNLHEPELIPESEKLLMQAFTTRERVLGKNHPTTLTSLASLGGLYRRCGMLADAEQCYSMALDGCINELGPQHPKSLQNMTSLALVLEDLGRLDEAEEMLRTVLPILQEKFAPDHSSVTTCQCNLGCLLYKRGQLEEAEQLLKIVVDRDTRLFGLTDRKTCGTRTSYATILREIEGRIQESIDVYKSVLDERKKLIGVANPVYNQSIQNLTDAYIAGDQTQNAILLHEQYVVDLATELGESHPETLRTKGFYGGVVFESVAMHLKRGEVPQGEIKETVEKALGITDESVQALMTTDAIHSKGMWLLVENLLMMCEVLGRNPPAYVAELEAQAAALATDQPQTNNNGSDSESDRENEDRDVTKDPAEEDSQPSSEPAMEVTEETTTISDGEDPEGLQLGFPEDEADVEA